MADRALAAEQDVEESKPGVAEIKVDETSKLVGLLEDLSKRIKKLETVTTSERKRNKGRGRANNYAHAPALSLMYRPQVSLVTNIANIETLNIMLDLSLRRRIRKQPLDLAFRRRTHREMTPLRLRIRLMHLSAIFTRLSVTRHARAEAPAHFL